MGPAGLTVVIIKKDLIGLADEKTPSMLNCGLVLEWLETQIGGLENM